MLHVHCRKPVSQFASLIEKMLMLDPAKRVNVKDALQHPFFTDAAKAKEQTTSA